jgi:Ohr subfamily peroxiredoxin
MGHAKSADGHLDVRLALPRQLGGAGDATNPEQLFAAGFAACFEMAARETARQMKKPIGDSSVTADVTLNALDSGAFALSVRLNVELKGIKKEEAREIVAAAEKICPYANAVRGNVDVQIEVV